MIGRVRHRSTFTDLRRRGVRATSGPISVTFAADPSPVSGPAAAEPPVPRVAFAVPRKVGKAVVRNRVRRRLRAVFVEAGADQAPAGAYLVAVRPAAAGLTYRELSEHVHRALTEIAKRPARRPRRPGSTADPAAALVPAPPPERTGP